MCRFLLLNRDERVPSHTGLPGMFYTSAVDRCVCAGLAGLVNYSQLQRIYGLRV